jgi:hypothetical protein
VLLQSISWAIVKPLPSSVEESTVLVVGLLVTFPRCFDFHCSAEELAVTCLQNGLDRVLDDHWIGSFRLRSVKGVFGFIQLGGQSQFKPPFANGEF